MTLTEWNSQINQKFFSFSKKPADNTVITTYLSGRKTGFRKNTNQIMQFSCKLKLTKAEENIFWNWYDDMGALLGAFTCPALGTGYFTFVSIPSPDGTDQKYTILNMELEQVY